MKQPSFKMMWCFGAFWLCFVPLSFLIFGSYHKALPFTAPGELQRSLSATIVLLEKSGEEATACALICKEAPIQVDAGAKGALMKVMVVFYSTYGHVYRLAEAIAEGARGVAGAEVLLKRVPETLPHDVLKVMNASEAQKAFSHIPVAAVNDLPEADAILFGTPTRFGNMAAQMRQFLDATGELWVKNKLVGKVGSVFASSATQHGGQESTILSFHTTLLHQGMVIVGLPYTFQGQNRIDEITGASPYGASTIAGSKGERLPSENELEAARFQGRHVAQIAKKLAA